MGRLLGLVVGAGRPPRPGQAPLPSRSLGGVLWPCALLPNVPWHLCALAWGQVSCAQFRRVEIWLPAPAGAVGVTLFSRFVPAVVKQCSVKAWISLKPTPNSAKKTGIHLAHLPRPPAPQATRACWQGWASSSCTQPSPFSKGTFQQARGRAGSGQAEAQEEWGC